DLAPAALADSVRPLLDPPQRVVDRGEDLLRVLLEALVELAVERGGGDVAEMLVDPHELARLVLEAPGVLLVEVLDGTDDPFPTLAEEALELLEVDRRQLSRPLVARPQWSGAAPSRRG